MLREVMADVGFVMEDENADSVLARLPLPAMIADAALVTVVGDDQLLPAPPVTSGHDA